MKIPNAKVAKPNVVGHLVSYLVSAEAHYVTGELHFVSVTWAYSYLSPLGRSQRLRLHI
jgi:hypothetical protein